MTSSLNSYLVQHKSLSIPGLGTIYVEGEPATRDAAADRWMPPVVLYRFDKFHDTPGKEFFCFLAEQKGIPEYEAIKWYNEFAASFRGNLRVNEEARWEGVGIFKKDATGEIMLEPLAKSFELFEPMEAHEIVRQLEPELVTEQEIGVEEVPILAEQEPLVAATAKRDWWILALVLFTIILLLLVFHFYQHGLIWRSFFNQQPIF